MAIKNHLISVSEILATASMVGIGLAIGDPIGTAIVAALGIELSGSILDNHLSKLKEKWLSSNDGILNHDIQQALVRAFIKSLDSLEKKYFTLEETNELPKEKKEAIKSLFQELKDEAQAVFLPSIEKAIKEEEVKSYLYGKPQEAKKTLWERIDGTNLIYTYYGEHFKTFLRDNSLDEVVFWFGEELKTDNKACNKAWRAFQRMLLEGIQADVKAVQAGQDVIHRDLQTLSLIREQLNQLKDTINHRLPNEPFQESFAKALTDIKTVLQSVAQTTRRTEEKIDALAADVKTILTIRSLLDKTNKEKSNTPDELEKHLILSKGTDVISESILTDLIESELITMLSHGGFTQTAHTAAINTIRQNESLQRRLTATDVSKLNYLLQREVSTSFLRGAVDEYARRRLRDSLSGAAPIVVASSCMMLATIAILYYLKHHEGYNITIAHAYPHAMELAKLITAHTIEPPDAVVMALATVPPLLNKINHYTPRMLMPPNPHRIITPHTTKDRPQLSEGEFYFSRDEQSTALYEWETLGRNRILNPDRSRPFHLEPDQVLSDLSDDRNEQRYILWTPIWQLILRLGIGVPIDKPYWFDAILFFHERFDRSPASSDLALAIMHTWLELLYNDYARHTAIHYMLSDKDYVDNLMKFTGIADLMLLKAQRGV